MAARTRSTRRVASAIARLKYHVLEVIWSRSTIECAGSAKRIPCRRSRMLRSSAFLGSVVFLVLAACAHTDDGARVRTGNVRFDANSVSSPRFSVRKASDGAWRSSKGWALVQEGDVLRYEGTPYSVQITRRPDGLLYEPSWVRGASWTFVTEDGQPIAPELEAPLYIATRAGLSGQWLALWT